MLWLITLGSSQSSSHRFSSIFHVLLILACSTHLSQCLDPSASVTIYELPAYSLQRQCGKGCIQNNYDPGADVEKVLGCTWNGCYCGTQYQAAATSIISSCWSSYCTTEESLLSYDISTALSIYDAYCGIGAAGAPTTVLATTTGANSPTSATVINDFPSQTGNSNGGATTVDPSATGTSRSSGSSPLSSGGIIGIGVSVICSVLGLVFGIGFKIWSHRRKERRLNQQQMGWY